MKYISFVVPCYNSQDYMEKCIDSLLIGSNDVEIIIVDDGSTDNTGKIADKYQKKYPDIVKVIHQKNGGHGEGINVGLKHATGKYFKVIDSDDWVDQEAYLKILDKVKYIDSDLIIMNYTYTYTDGRSNQTINFSNIFPNDKEVTWDEMGSWGLTQYPSLHSMMYKRSVLNKTKIKLPKHIYYEDNLFIYLPLINTNSVYYLNVDFYQYFIGRPDQSVQDAQLIKRSSHQVDVTKAVCLKYDLDDVLNKKLKKLMYRECVFMMTIAIVFSRLSYTDEGEEQYKKLWLDIKEGNPKFYKKLKMFSMAAWASLPGRIGRSLSIGGYKIAHRLVKFN